MVALGGQAFTEVLPPQFIDVAQVGGEVGVFEAEIEMPIQNRNTVPISMEDNVRCYKLVLTLDGRTVHEDVYKEQSIQKARFEYASSESVILTGTVVDGNDKESSANDCRYEIRYVPSGFVVSFEGCPNASVNDCSIEGLAGGVLVRESALMLIDCEIILVGDDFIEKDDVSQVIEQNVRKIIRS